MALLLATIVMCSLAIADGGPRSTASITLTARVLPRAELSSPALVTGQARLETLGTDRFRITAQAGTTVDVSFSLWTNSQAAQLHIWSEGSAELLVDIRPVATDCDWIHAPVAIGVDRVAAVLYRCSAAQRQAGMATIRTHGGDASMVLLVEPLSR